MKSGFATFVPGVTDMSKASNSPDSSFDLFTKPKLTQLTFHIQEYNIPVKNILEENGIDAILANPYKTKIIA